MMSASVGWLLATDPSRSLFLCKVLPLRELLFTEWFGLVFVFSALWFPLAPRQKLPHLLIDILVNKSRSFHWGYYWPALQDGNAVPMAQCWCTSGNTCTFWCNSCWHNLFTRELLLPHVAHQIITVMVERGSNSTVRWKSPVQKNMLNFLDTGFLRMHSLAVWGFDYEESKPIFPIRLLMLF